MLKITTGNCSCYHFIVINYQSREIKSLTKSPPNTHTHLCPNSTWTDKNIHTTIYILSAAICCKWWAINSVALSLQSLLGWHVWTFLENICGWDNKQDGMMEKQRDKGEEMMKRDNRVKKSEATLKIWHSILNQEFEKL